MTDKEEKSSEEIPNAWKERLKRHIPILQWLPKYKKTDLIADAIAGITVGLTLIPQSVAYAGLAGLSPEYGLYSAFMGSFIYVIFGTIKEVSVGPTSILSLLTIEFTKDLTIDFVFLLSFLSGCVELLLGVLQFGFLVNFISVPVTTSFQSAVSLIIVSSQLKDLLGVPKFKSGRFLINILAVGERIKQARTGDIILSIFCCIFLLSLRKLKDVKVSKSKEPTKNERIIQKTLWFISIGRNAACVVICCVIAYTFSLHGEFPFRLAGNVPPGLPPFRLPPFKTQMGNETYTFPEMVYEIGPAVVILPLIAILMNVTIAKAFAAGASVDATQEMLTLGMANIAGSFVGSMPVCGAFTRSAVSHSSGIRSPLAGLFTGSLILLVIRFLTPYFYYIPKATLASVLVCAVIFMFDGKTILLFWKVNKKDFICAVVTFSACLTLGIQVGLLFGVAVNIGHLLHLWAKPSVSVQIKTLNGGNYYLVTPDIGLFFPATDFIRNEIDEKCVENIPVVIDCIHLKGIDYTTAQGIKEIGRCCKKKGQKLLFINMRFKIYRVLKNSNVGIALKQCSAADEDLNDILFHQGEPELFSCILVEKLDSADL